MNAVFQALSDPTRREILRLLRKREMTAGQLAEQFPLAKSTLSGHFNILKHAGLIVRRTQRHQHRLQPEPFGRGRNHGRRDGAVRSRQTTEKGETMKPSWRTELPQWIIIAAMFAVAAWSWPRLPDHIPIHWNLAGEVDGYGGKFTGLLVLPLFAVGLYLLMRLMYLIDPGKDELHQLFLGPSDHSHGHSCSCLRPFISPPWRQPLAGGSI